MSGSTLSGVLARFSDRQDIARSIYEFAV